MNSTIKLKQLTVRLPNSLHRQFKSNAAKQGRSMGEVAIELIKKYVKETSDPL